MDALQRRADDELLSLNGRIGFLLRKALKEEKRSGGDQKRSSGNRRRA